MSETRNHYPSEEVSEISQTQGDGIAEADSLIGDFGRQADADEIKEIDPDIARKMLELKSAAETKAGEINAEMETIKHGYSSLEDNTFSQNSKKFAEFYLDLVDALITKNEGKALLRDACLQDIKQALSVLQETLKIVQSYETKITNLDSDQQNKEKEITLKFLENIQQAYPAILARIRNKSEWPDAYPILKRQWEDIAADELEEKRQK